MFRFRGNSIDLAMSYGLSGLGTGLVALAIALGAWGVQGAAALDRKAASFEGLWEGVDRADGSSLQLSIVGKENGGYEVLLRDSFFSLCIADGFTNGRGINVGEGTLTDPDVLVFEFTLNCFADDDPTKASQTNVGSVELSLRSEGEILVIGFDPEIFLHRVGG